MGTTVGKKVFGLVIVRVNGAPLGFGKALTKNFVSTLAYAFASTIIAIVVAITFGNSDKNQTMFDSMVDAVVVKKHNVAEVREFKRQLRAKRRAETIANRRGR